MKEEINQLYHTGIVIEGQRLWGVFNIDEELKPRLVFTDDDGKYYLSGKNITPLIFTSKKKAFEIEPFVRNQFHPEAVVVGKIIMICETEL